VELVPFPVKFVWSAFPFGNIDMVVASAVEDYQQMEPRLCLAYGTSGTRAFSVKFVWSAFPFGNMRSF
jgi:hypothetical protein